MKQHNLYINDLRISLLKEINEQYQNAKMKTHQIAYKFNDNHKQRKLLFECCQSLKVDLYRKKTDKKDTKKKITKFTCKSVFCPICRITKMMKIAKKTLAMVLNLHQKKQAQFIFLTLTQNHCELKNLAKLRKKTNKASADMMKNLMKKGTILGYVRASEIVFYKNRKNNCHPHYHFILAVPNHYFLKSRGIYKSTKDWVQLWRKQLKLDYDPICDSRRVRVYKDKSKTMKSILEVAKYSMKDSDFDNLNPDQMDQLSKLIRGTRFISSAGILKFKNAELTEEESEIDLSEYDWFAKFWLQFKEQRYQLIKNIS